MTSSLKIPTVWSNWSGLWRFLHWGSQCCCWTSHWSTKKTKMFISSTFWKYHYHNVLKKSQSGICIKAGWKDWKISKLLIGSNTEEPSSTETCRGTEPEKKIQGDFRSCLVWASGWGGCRHFKRLTPCERSNRLGFMSNMLNKKCVFPLSGCDLTWSLRKRSDKSVWDSWRRSGGRADKSRTEPLSLGSIHLYVSYLETPGLMAF